jgi:hypothetical protein
MPTHKSRPVRSRPVAWCSRSTAEKPSGAEDEDDLRAAELTRAHPVEWPDLLHAEVLREPPALAGEARSVHDDAAREVAPRRIPDAAEPVAAVRDSLGRSRRRTRASVPVEDENNGGGARALGGGGWLGLADGGLLGVPR